MTQKWQFDAKARQIKLHAERAAAGRCINEHGRPHELPTLNPKTQRPYTKCPACRETHSGIGEKAGTKGEYKRGR